MIPIATYPPPTNYHVDTTRSAKPSERNTMNTVRFQDASRQAKLSGILDWWGFDDEPRKLDVRTFSLPSGYSCPFASDCLSKADRKTGKITDGKNMAYRCFAATMEAFKTNVRDSRWDNFDALRKLKTVDAMVTALLDALPIEANVVRIHVGGDFFNQRYFDAWLRVATMRPQTQFYAYTKSIGYWVARLGSIPANLSLNASRGGTQDHLIDEHGLKTAEVVYTEQEAAERGLPIDHDEYHAIKGAENFALLLHGTQPKGSKAAAALKALKAEGVRHSYSAVKSPVPAR